MATKFKAKNLYLPKSSKYVKLLKDIKCLSVLNFLNNYRKTVVCKVKFKINQIFFSTLYSVL